MASGPVVLWNGARGYVTRPEAWMDHVNDTSKQIQAVEAEAVVPEPIQPVTKPAAKPKPAAKTFGKTFGSAPTKPRLALGDLTPSFSPKPLPPPKPLVVPQRPTHKVLAARSSPAPIIVPSLSAEDVLSESPTERAILAHQSWLSDKDSEALRGLEAGFRSRLEFAEEEQRCKGIEREPRIEQEREWMHERALLKASSLQAAAVAVPIPRRRPVHARHLLEEVEAEAESHDEDEEDGDQDDAHSLSGIAGGPALAVQSARAGGAVFEHGKALQRLSNASLPRPLSWVEVVAAAMCGSLALIFAFWDAMRGASKKQE